MNSLYLIYFFILGTVFGSFANVVGSRLPIGMSIVKPSSHCTKCNHKLKIIELIPIISYIIQKGKCRNCKSKLSIEYPIFELVTGALFLLSYLFFGISYELLLSLIFILFLVIITISDYHYMVIPDVIISFGSILIIILKYFIYDFNTAINCIISGVIACLVMWLIKILGDYIFKKESLGIGDIKLMFFIGLMLNFPIAIFSIFLGSFIALPIALIILIIKKNNMLAFGPYLSIAAVILLLLKININDLYNLFINLY